MDDSIANIATALMPYVEVAGSGAALYLAGQTGEATAEKALALLDRLKGRLPRAPKQEDLQRALRTALASGEVTPQLLEPFLRSQASNAGTTVHGDQFAEGSIFNGSVNVNGSFKA
jgi:hypothetical protein